MLEFIKLLDTAPLPNVFNPWRDVDKEHDMDSFAPHIRREQLQRYLAERRNARYMLLGEGLSYQGGHFTGIAMTSERILLGGMRHKGITPQMVFSGLVPRRTSAPAFKKNGFSENTATIVWGFMAEQRLNCQDFIFWNAFPWHPWNAARGILSNRAPLPTELARGRVVLQALLHSHQFTQIIAVGNHAKTTLDKMGIPAAAVRHPAFGGASLFKTQIQAILSM
ncbi:MAG TPA: uracil-DNA glycosylase [bacterium]|nr:uracil-DNA glycosylase [bacterium]HPN45111.1 uracil-DNA glycosylase [bacterium]